MTKLSSIKKTIKNKAEKIFFLLLVLASTINLSAEIINSDCNNQIFFVSPVDGFISEKQEIFFEFGTRNISIDPAGKIPSESINACFVSGHHHLIINGVYEPSKGGSIPFKNNIFHFGGGQTSAAISLDPGKYSLQLVLGDYMHMPINIGTGATEDHFITSKKIFIEVLN